MKGVKKVKENREEESGSGVYKALSSFTAQSHGTQMAYFGPIRSQGGVVSIASDNATFLTDRLYTKLSHSVKNSVKYETKP